MFSKTILIVAAASLLMIASLNMAQQAGTPATTPVADDAAVPHGQKPADKCS